MFNARFLFNARLRCLSVAKLRNNTETEGIQMFQRLPKWVRKHLGSRNTHLGSS